MIGLLGWIGSGLVVASLVQHDVRRLRQVNLAACGALVIFNLALGIVSMIVLNIVLAAVNGYHLLRTRTDAPRTVATSLGDTEPAREQAEASLVGAGETRRAIERCKVLAGHHPSRPV